MAYNDPISSQALRAVAEQIASAIESGLVAGISRRTLTPLALGSTLAVWGLKPRVVAAVREGFVPAALDDWAQPLNRWHHQVKFDRNSEAFARSLSAPSAPADEHPAEPPAEPSAAQTLASLRQLS